MSIAKICGNGFLHPNSPAEVAAAVNCTKSTVYQCLDQYNLPKDDFMTLNSTDNATAVPVCTEAFYTFTVTDTTKYDESLVVPDLVKVASLYVAGDFPTHLNATTINFPDLVNVTGNINIQFANKVTNLKLPKLEVVGGYIHVDLSAPEGSEEPPAISLTFPSLTSLGAGLMVLGNINR